MAHNWCMKSLILVYKYTGWSNSMACLTTKWVKQYSPNVLSITYKTSSQNFQSLNLGSVLYIVINQWHKKLCYATCWMILLQAAYPNMFCPFSDLVCKRECANKTMNLKEVICILKYQPEQRCKSKVCFGRQSTHWYGNLEGVSQFHDCVWHHTLQERTLWSGYLSAGSFLMADLYSDTPFVLYFSLNAITDYSSGRKRIRVTVCASPFAIALGEFDFCSKFLACWHNLQSHKKS